jgi:uncharacterized membrane protein
MAAEVDSSGRSSVIDPNVQETNFSSEDIIHQTDGQVEAARSNGYGTLATPDDASPPPTNNGNDGHDDGQPPKPPAGASARAIAPDILRGLLMVLMAMDHAVVILHPWDHGQARLGEADSLPVKEWNKPLGFVIRSLTDLCAPGFTFLLGMGVVYFGRSRTRLGWTSAQMLRHFVVRGLVLTLITVLMGIAFTGGQVWFLNAILFALAVDYVIAGMLWLALNKTEVLLARLLSPKKPRVVETGARQPLLDIPRGPRRSRKPERQAERAAAISWHAHNVVLVVLAGVTIWWNIWLSPTHGHCQIGTPEPIKTEMVPENSFLRIWFWTMMSGRIFSGFPPMAWLSFAILGLLYGRLMLVRTAEPQRLHWETLLASLAFLLLFVATRLFRFGNLSENCLGMPEHLAHPDLNPYLASVPSFFYLIKYPPDVAFFAYTMSLNLALLALFGALPLRITKRCTVLLAYGTSALFFYLVHQVLIFALGAALVNIFGHPTGGHDPVLGHEEKGIDSVWVYFGFVAFVLAVLYPLCKWYSGFKARKSVDSIWRFF